MKKRLFLTGPMGCGKSTIIAAALGEQITRCGGFLTRRHRGETLYFTLESPDGHKSETFLDFPEGKPRLNMDVFSRLGISLLDGDVLVLDEIGGIELLCPEFMAALEQVLRSGVPILGVIKGEAPAGALIRALGLSREYEEIASLLRARLREDADTLYYECSQFDEKALLLAKQWAEENCHD